MAIVDEGEGWKRDNDDCVGDRGGVSAAEGVLFPGDSSEAAPTFFVD